MTQMPRPSWPRRPSVKRAGSSLTTVTPSRSPGWTVRERRSLRRRGKLMCRPGRRHRTSSCPSRRCRSCPSRRQTSEPRHRSNGASRHRRYGVR
jgi:hypothetical protein